MSSTNGAPDGLGNGPAVKALAGVGTFLDDRLRAAKSTRTLLKKIFPDHWTFLLGEIALYSFIILLLTGTFLTFFFKPSMTSEIYHGTYTHLNGVRMSEAYASTLNISFDVRGGLLMRQIHHWAADLFMAAILAHMLRMFFTGAYRKPRELNWLIGLVLFTLGILEGLFGYSLPDDLLSGTGLRILEGVMLSIPIVGTYLTFFLFGGQFPGHDIIPRLYIIHVLLIPGLLLALISAHLFLMFHQKHTQMPGLGRTDKNVVGQPTYPYFMAKTGAFFLFIFGVLALLSTFAQINPIWLYGPYNPAEISAGSQPDFYMGFLEGALRIWPSWSWNVAGHTFAFNVFLPGLVPLGVIITGLAVWPFIEQWITGDRHEHHVNDRPRNAATRTSIGVAGVTFYGILWAEGANDIIADHLNISLYVTTEIARYAIVIGPIVAYILTKRICLGLQRKDVHTLQHGYETGIIRQLPDGEYIEEERPVPEENRAVLLAKPQAPALMGPAPDDENGVPDPSSRSPIGKLRLRLNRVLTESVPLELDGHPNGHGDGHGNGQGEPDQAAVARGRADSAGRGQLPPGGSSGSEDDDTSS
ncbi:MAG TPA: ubiquinol-cytochrome c reductase cytochrome b subunit [Streptosporangiaceae bacterium]|nr:ubiquinol-cytochrome c reductase cytochrome b subunit [Streptosporangiaceae bacterium]